MGATRCAVGGSPEPADAPAAAAARAARTAVATIRA